MQLPYQNAFMGKQGGFGLDQGQKNQYESFNNKTYYQI